MRVSELNSFEPPVPSPATRRNGTLQSCEPCRKSKLRCDHVRPVCGRCVTKNIPDKCFYHPAPMTRRIIQERATASPIARHQRLASQPNSAASSPGGSLGSGRFHTSLEPHSALPGYLGSTSYSAILAEHRGGVTYELDNVSDPGTPPRSVEPDRLQSGSEVLKLLYDLSICDNLVRNFYKRTWMAIMPNVVIESIICSIRRLFYGFPSASLPSLLQDFTAEIFQNSSHPLKTHASMTVGEYCLSCTGRNSRWEALGNIFAIAGLSLMSTPDNDPDLVQVAPDTQAKERLLAQIVEASAICLSFCDQAASANELLGFLQYNDVMLRTQQYGDSSYQAWRRLGDLSATIYASGLHQDNIPPTDDCPFFLRQWRRSCFASAFYADKALATFVGRPPLINYRYCTLTPPLDLSDDALIAGGDTLNRALGELDMAGWDTRHRRHRVSATRLRFLLSIFREETLEIALGTHSEPDLVQKSNHVLEKARATWEACPDHLRYDRHVRVDENEPYAASFTLLLVYLDYLYTAFLLQRTLVKRANTGQNALFDTSRQLLSIVIKISADRDPHLDLSRDISWIVLYYGLPSASVLTLELLRQSQEAGPHNIVLPRAELIRNLSVFVSCLSWVARPSHGNYHMCKEAEKKLSHILDQILDPRPIQSEIFNDATSNLDGFLDWYNTNNWDFNSEFLPSRDGLPL